MVEEMRVACTVMAKDETGRYVFLVINDDEEFLFPSTIIEPEKTGLACIIERIKMYLSIEIDYLELTECTNIIINGQNSPMYVFTYKDQSIENPKKLLSLNSKLFWFHAENLTTKLKNWEISGVPRFFL